MFKAALAEAARSTGGSAVEEFSGSGWRADVMAAWPATGQGSEQEATAVALEVQTSPQEHRQTVRRQRQYQRERLGCIWLFKPPPLDALGRASPGLPVFGLRWREGAGVARAGGEEWGRAQALLPVPSAVAPPKAPQGPRASKGLRSFLRAGASSIEAVRASDASREQAVKQGRPGRARKVRYSWSYERAVGLRDLLLAVREGRLRWTPSLRAAQGSHNVTLSIASPMGDNGPRCPECREPIRLPVGASRVRSRAGTPLPADDSWSVPMRGVPVGGGDSLAALLRGGWGGGLLEAVGRADDTIAVPRIRPAGVVAAGDWGLACGRCGAALPVPKRRPAARGGPAASMRVDDPFGDLTQEPGARGRESGGGRTQWVQWQQDCETPLLPHSWRAAELEGEWRQNCVDVALDPHKVASRARKMLAEVRGPHSMGAAKPVREQLLRLLPPSAQLSDAEVVVVLQAQQFAAHRPGLGLWEVEPQRA